VRDEASDFRSDVLAGCLYAEKEAEAGGRDVEAGGILGADLGQHLPIYFPAGGDCLKHLASSCGIIGFTFLPGHVANFRHDIRSS
jgi:hypothetical protein